MAALHEATSASAARRAPAVPLGAVEVPACRVRPDNYRAVDDVGLLQALADSLAGGIDPKLGGPPTVREEAGGWYRLVCGHHRFAAMTDPAYGLAWEYVPVMLQPDLGSAAANQRADIELQLRENGQRKEDSPLDQARACAKAREAGFTDAEIKAQRGFGKLALVEDRIGLLTLAPDLQAAIPATLSLSEATALGRVAWPARLAEGERWDIQRAAVRIHRQTGAHAAAEARGMLDAPSVQGGLFDGDWGSAAEARVDALRAEALPQPSEPAPSASGTAREVVEAQTAWCAAQAARWLARGGRREAAGFTARAEALQLLLAALPREAEASRPAEARTWDLVPGVSRPIRVLLAGLGKLAGGTDRVTATVAQVAAAAGVSEATAHRAIANAEVAGLLVVERSNRAASVYRLP